MARTVLIIDDERNMRWVLERALEKAGYDVLTAERGEQGLQQFALNAVDLVLLDLKMPGMDGMNVLRRLRRRSATVPILLLTAYASVPTAVEALQIGATDYLRKPFDLETVLATINRYLAAADDARTNSVPASAADDTAARATLAEFVGATYSLQSALSRAQAAQQRLAPVLLRGEEGTGKRHLARLIHYATDTTQRQHLVELDCAALPPAVLERELSNAGTDEQMEGRWQEALGGTLLLANANALSVEMAHRTRELLMPYLYSHTRPHGLRLMLTATATLHAAWEPLVTQALAIELPPLRERLADLPLLLAHFTPATKWERGLIAQLRAYAWPGNVAELKRVVQQAAFLAGQQTVTSAYLPSHILSVPKAAAGIFVLPPEGIDLEVVEEELIRQALEMAHGNKTQAARLLGLSRATLLYRLDKYAILADSAEDDSSAA